MHTSASSVSSSPSGSIGSMVFGREGAGPVGPGYPNTCQLGFCPVAGSGAP